MDALVELKLLIESRYPLIVIDSFEEDRVESALERVAKALGLPLFSWTLTQGLARTDTDSAIYDTNEPAKALANLQRLENEGIFYFKDLAPSLSNPTIQRLLRDLAPQFSQDRRTLVVSGSGVELPAELRRYAARHQLRLPGRGDLSKHARNVVRRFGRAHDIEIAIEPADFERMVDNLSGLTLFEAERALAEAILRDMALTDGDIDHVAAFKQRRLAEGGLLEMMPRREDEPTLAGLGNLKAWLAKRAHAFSDEAREFGLPSPKGVLLLGVQGCGKSLAARAVAREWNMPLLRLEASRLYDRFVGESEANLERALETAERMAPCVLLVDEIEKGFASGAGSTADAGLSQRILGRLLTWLQDRDAAIFVVATCNSVTELPPELMRKGRFDEIFFVDLPDADERRAIFEVHLRARDRDPAAFDVAALADASVGFSGAEIESVVVAALHTAFAARDELGTEHVLEEIRATRPLSVTRAEDIDALRQWARGRAVSASNENESEVRA